MTVDKSHGFQAQQAAHPLGMQATQAASPRVEILHEAAKLTSGLRDKEYGDPSNNLSCAGEMKRVFRKYCQRPISAMEQEALDMVITKLSRLSTGAPKRDTYVDMAAYSAIAGEVAMIAASPTDAELAAEKLKHEQYRNIHQELKAIKEEDANRENARFNK